MISKKDIKSMPITFIVAPILIIFLTVFLITSYNDMISEKSYIASLSCPELMEYTDQQTIKSKLYFGNENYLIYAEERISNQC